MNRMRSLYDTLSAAYDRSMARQRAEEAKRNALFAQDKGATIEETMANAYDRLHPEEAAGGVDPSTDALSATVTGVERIDTLIGADGGDLLDPYEYELPLEFYGALAPLESGGKGYGAVNYHQGGDWNKNAWGAYGITGANLKTAGLLDDNGNWTGQWGISSAQDFWNNKNQAQERALDEYMRLMEGYNDERRNFDHVGTVNQRRILPLQDARNRPILDAFGHEVHPPLKITESGLQAAAQRAGQLWVDTYLQWLKSNGWESAGKDFPTTVPFRKGDGSPYTAQEIKDWLRAVETRLRLFENVPYRRLTVPRTAKP